MKKQANTQTKWLAVAGILVLTAGCSGEATLKGDLGAPEGATVDTPATTPATTTPATTTTTTTTTPTTTASLTQTDVKKVVSFGEGIDFNGQTGGPNDIAIHPTSKLPAVAYYDKSLAASGTTAVGALKLAQLDSTGNWNIEVVDANFGTATCTNAGATCIGAPNAAAGGANIAQIIQLKFKSTGLAVIAYVYGASTTATKEVRVAEQNTNGSWTISQVTYAGYANVNVTNDPIKSITLTLDSSDRLHITFAFYHSTETSSQLVYAYRNAAGLWNSYDVVALLSGGALALGAGMNQSTAAFCPLDGTFLTSSTEITGAGASTVKIHKCTPDTTGGCPNVASWTTATMTAALSLSADPAAVAAGIGGGRQTLLINAANKIIFGSTDDVNGINFAISNQTCSTALAGLTWSAAAPQIVTASAGITGFDAALTSSNIIVFSGVGSTAFQYAKTATDLTAGFAVGDIITAETVTAGNDGVGIAYDSTNDIVYGSYAALPGAALGAAGNDVKVAYAYPADIASTGTQVTVNVIDQTTSMFASTSIPALHAAKAPNGTVGYAYFYKDSGASPSATSRLYYGAKGGTAASPYFAANLVQNFSDSGAASTDYVGQYPALTYDSSSNPVIAYHDAAQNTNGYLMVARSNNHGTSFTADWVDGTGATTVGQFPSAAAYGDVIGISYYDYTGANTGLKFARWKPGTGWRKYVVDGMTGATGTGCSTTEDAGKFTSFKWTSDGRPVIAYQSNPAGTKKLKIAYATEASTSATYTWTCLTLDTSANVRGEGIDMILTSADIPHIAHFDTTAGAIRYVTCATAISSCVTTGTSAFTAERISLVSTVTSVASRPSIQVGSNGKRYATYYSAADQAMILATKSTTDTLWAYETIDSPAISGGSFVSAAGQHAVLLLNSSGYPMMFYRSLENWLKFFSREML